MGLETATITFLHNVLQPWIFSNLPLAEAFDEIKSSKYKAQIEILRAQYLSNKTAYKEEKPKLPAYCFHGTFSGSVKNENLIASSNLFNADIDGLKGDIEADKQAISKIPGVVAVWVSPSGVGLKVLLRLEIEAIKNYAHFKKIFRAAERAFAAIGYEIDSSCKDIRRLCFVSYDPNIYLNYGAAVFEYEQWLPAEPEKPGVKGAGIGESQAQAQAISSSQYSIEGDCIGVVTGMLSKAKIGERHGARLSASRLAGGYVAGGLVDEQLIWDSLVKASDLISDSGETSDTEYNTLVGAFNHGQQTPISIDEFRKAHGYNIAVFDPTTSDNPIKSAVCSSDVRDGTETTRPLTELGNAQRLYDSHADNVKYIEGAGWFLHWNTSTKSWQWDVSGAMTRTLAASLPVSIYKEGEQYLQQVQKFAAWSRSSQSESTIKAAVSLYKDFPQARVPLHLIDGNPFMVGLDNARQVIDLKTGVVRDAQRDDYITKALNVHSLGQSKQAKRWLLFLSEVFGDDPELIEWLQKWCGYILTGSTAEQCFLFLYGFGANGKSVLIDTLRFIMGDYARAIASETLTETKRAGGSASPDLADLIGARLALTTETEEGVALAESLLKALTGGDTLTARKLYSAPTQFTPQFKIMMSGNHKPLIKGNDDGIWRRVRLLPFTKTFDESKRDTHLAEKLRAEAPHILAWMVEGCLLWQEQGLADIPKTIKDATAEYKDDQDLIGGWLAECCQLNPTQECVSTVLYNSYKYWCEINGLMKSSNRVFGRRLSERGFTSRRSNGASVWAGVGIIPLVFTV
ncbi:MAG: phage/plasmid primase, P4 family [Methylobacter sp.]|nr:phage/plasmid primase, P4 family [Methylobacter sp.]